MRRVVITGLGVVAPNGTGVAEFRSALRAGRSGIRFHQQLQDLKLTCQVAGFPLVDEQLMQSRFTAEQRRSINGVMTFGALAATESWLDAGLQLSPEETDWNAGTIFGTGIGGVDTIGDRLAPMTCDGQSRRMGSAVPEQASAAE